MIDSAIPKAAALIEALSYIQRFHDKTIVVKIGGSIMDDETALSNILTDVVFMNYVNMQPILVHGGGKAINQKMEQAGLVPQMVHGRRYTDDRVLAIAEQVLCNEINRFIVTFIQSQGCEAMGLKKADYNPKINPADFQPEPGTCWARDSTHHPRCQVPRSQGASAVEDMLVYWRTSSHLIRGDQPFVPSRQQKVSKFPGVNPP